MFQSYLKYSLFKTWLEAQPDNVVIGNVTSITDHPFTHYLNSLKLLQPTYQILVWSHTIEVLYQEKIVLKEELPLWIQYFDSYLTKHHLKPTKQDCLKCLQRYVKYSNG